MAARAPWPHRLRHTWSWCVTSSRVLPRISPMTHSSNSLGGEEGMRGVVCNGVKLQVASARP
jgi:hypothetical protein